MDEKLWKLLIKRINDQRCMPFLGAGACVPSLPLGGEVAARWAKEFGYPLDNATDLAQVAQYLAIENDPQFPKEEILAIVKAAPRPDFRAPGEPHGVLADLPLPIYLTSNYDDFMFRALEANIFRKPTRELCRWNKTVEDEPSSFDRGYIPDVANPVVYHLHGHTRPETIVITEDDYLTFLATMVGNNDLVPAPLRSALSTNSTLFIGYRLADWNFRILFQSLLPRLKTTGFAVLYPPSDPDRAAKQRAYFDKYYGALDLHVYWGTARDFCLDLRQRWEAAKR